MNKDREFAMASTLFDSEGNRIAEVAPLTGDNAHVLKNNIAFPNKNSQVGECWEYIPSQGINHYVECPAGENNTWDLKLDLTVDDFESLDDPSMTVTGKDLSTIAGILGPRNADGSLPSVGFLKLKKGSRAIDKGEDLGFPFAGVAPDLGAFEYGMPSSSSMTPSSSVTSSSSVTTSSSSVTESSSVAASSDSNSQSSSSNHSQHETESIFSQFEFTAKTSGPALVFDMQGRYLGSLQAEQLRGPSADRGILEATLHAKFKTPGAYIVRQGNKLQRVNVK
jgi:hypothetical protein